MTCKKSVQPKGGEKYPQIGSLWSIRVLYTCLKKWLTDTQNQKNFFLL